MSMKCSTGAVSELPKLKDYNKKLKKRKIEIKIERERERERGVERKLFTTCSSEPPHWIINDLSSRI